MSKKIVREVWEQAQVKSSGELVILLALAEHADDCGHAWPSLLRLMKYSRFSKRNVSPMVAYAAVYPLTTLMRILAVQILAACALRLTVAVK